MKGVFSNLPGWLGSPFAWDGGWVGIAHPGWALGAAMPCPAPASAPSGAKPGSGPAVSGLRKPTLTSLMWGGKAHANTENPRAGQKNANFCTFLARRPHSCVGVSDNTSCYFLQQVPGLLLLQMYLFSSRRSGGGLLPYFAGTLLPLITCPGGGHCGAAPSRSWCLAGRPARGWVHGEPVGAEPGHGTGTGPLPPGTSP